MLNFLEKHKVFFVYIPFTVYWIILFTATTIPGQDMPDLGFSDKKEHFIGYFIFTSLLYLTLLFQNRYFILKKYAGISAVIIAWVYGVIDELHQMLIPDRYADINDWFADAAGAVIAFIIIKTIIFISKYKQADIN